MKNGFTKFQNELITDVEQSLKEGATVLAASILIGIKHDVTAEYVQSTFDSYSMMKKVFG